MPINWSFGPRTLKRVHGLRNSAGSLAIFAEIRRALSFRLLIADCKTLIWRQPLGIITHLPPDNCETAVQLLISLEIS
jgi:hypothetical protein